MGEEKKTDPYAEHKAKLREYAKKQIDEVGVDRNQLNDEFVRQPPNFLRASAKYQEALHRATSAKQAFEALIANVDADIRRQASDDGKKLTEKAIEKESERDGRVVQARERLAFLNYQSNLYHSVVRAWEHRRDMLIQLGSNYRAEMDSTVTIKDRPPNGGSRDYLKLQDGQNVLRVLPPYDETGQFYQKVGFHRVTWNDPNKLVCPLVTFKEPCPVCAAIPKIKRKLGSEAARRFEPDRRAFVNALNLTAKDGKVYLFETPRTIINPILETLNRIGDDTPIDLEVGHNLIVVKKKKDNRVQYDVQFDLKPFNLNKIFKDPDSLYEKMNDLSKAPFKASKEDLVKMRNAIVDSVREGQTDEPGKDQPQKAAAQEQGAADEDFSIDGGKSGTSSGDEFAIDGEQAAAPAKEKPAKQGASAQAETPPDPDDDLMPEDSGGGLDEVSGFDGEDDALDDIPF
jgi:hypothetical protein